LIKHIVFWQLKESAHGKSKIENALVIKGLLENLISEISGIIRLEVGIDFSRTQNSADIALYSEFVSKEALATYQVHPAHLAAGGYVKEAAIERHVVDYES
jgi:hypothetical protein